MNYQDVIDDEEEEEFIPIPLQYVNAHDSSKCIFCNVKSGKYIKVKNNAWNKIFRDIETYSRTGNESIISRIKEYYDAVIRNPSNRLIRSGKCSHGFKEYPVISNETIQNHIKSFSFNNINIEKLKELTQLSRELAKNHLIGSDSNGKRVIDKENIKIYLGVVDRLAKFMPHNVKKIK